MQAALRKQEESGENLADILVTQGLITRGEEAAFVRAKSEETVFGVFDWDDAEFRFEADVLRNANVVQLDLEIDEILRRGLERQEQASDASEVLQNDAVILARTGKAVPAEISRDAIAVRILHLIDGQRTIAELLLTTHAPEYVVRKLLVGFVRGGQVEMAAVAPELFDSNELLDDLFREPIGEKHPDDPAIEDPIVEDEGNDEDVFTAAGLAPERVPVLVRPLKATLQAGLSPEELFVVGLIDGVADVKGITWVAPMRQVETLQILERLREKELVSITTRRGRESPSGCRSPAGG